MWLKTPVCEPATALSMPIWLMLTVLNQKACALVATVVEATRTAAEAAAILEADLKADLRSMGLFL